MVKNKNTRGSLSCINKEKMQNYASQSQRKAFATFGDNKLQIKREKYFDLFKGLTLNSSIADCYK